MIKMIKMLEAAINLLYLLSCIGITLSPADAYNFLTKKIDKWIENHKMHKEFRARKRAIVRFNTRNAIDVFALRIAEIYKMNNSLKLPDKRKLERMIKREYEQAKDYGFIDDMGRYHDEVFLYEQKEA